jgi:hypothetical protein
MAKNKGGSAVPVMDFPSTHSVEHHLLVSFIRSWALFNYKKYGNSGRVMIVCKGHSSFVCILI